MLKSPYSAKLLESIETQPGCWNYTKIGVFDGENQIGEYIRNYHNYVPFAPFQDKEGNWFALYSKNYMYSAVMSLPDCKEIWTEDKDKESYPTHFCPVELYVPILVIHDFKEGEVDPYPYNPRHDPDKWATKSPAGYFTYPDDKENKEKYPEKYQAWEEACEKFDKEHDEWYERHPFVEKYAQFGFVSGATWGDDSGGWKLQYLDLTDPYNVKRDARFGYIQLPNILLKDAIDVGYLEHDYFNKPNKNTINIAVSTRFDLTGKKFDD